MCRFNLQTANAQPRSCAAAGHANNMNCTTLTTSSCVNGGGSPLGPLVRWQAKEAVPHPEHAQ
eukprot:scaffold85781_cov61-Phaeocystis_antarctica.AAC.2